MKHLVTDQFLGSCLFILHLPRFSHTSAKRVNLSSYRGGLTSLLETSCSQFTSMVQQQILSINHHLTRKWLGAPHMGLAKYPMVTGGKKLSWQSEGSGLRGQEDLLATTLGEA